MQIKKITNKEVWNDFVQKNHGSFLQSWQWGQFQYTYGREIEYLVVEDEGKIIAGALIIKYDLPANRFYFFSPYGPVIYHELLLEYIQEKAEKEKAIFWRIENNAPGALKVKSVHPEHTLVLDLNNKTEDQLMLELKSKTRYNIRLAEKKGVKIKVSTDIEDLNTFYKLDLETAKRQKISLHPESYYQTMLHTLADAGMLKLYLAEYQGKILAANIILNFHDTVTYLHGGTGSEHREVMAPHLLQWQAILDAFKGGYKHYDFFGIAGTDDPEHPWAGITRFKKGYGGRIQNYPGTFELPLNNLWYRGYRLIKKII